MGHDNIVESLLGALMYTEDDMLVPTFSWAAMKGRLGLIKLLMGRKWPKHAWYDPSMGTPLLLAAQNGHTDLVEQLLAETDIDPNYTNRFGETALLAAAFCGYREIVVLLIRNDGVDVNHHDQFGHTSLMRACKQGSEQVVSALVEEGCCNVEATDMNGRSALYYALGSHSPEIVAKLLRAAPSTINSYDRGGYTPLHYASQEDSEEMIVLLLQWGAKVDARAFNGRTPLVCTAPYFSAQAKECLLKAGADATLTDHDGANVLHHCAMMGSPHGLELFPEAVNNAGSPRSIITRDRRGNNLLHHLLSGVDCSAATLEWCRVASLNRILTIEYLLGRGISVHECNYLGMIPLAQYLDAAAPLIPNRSACELLLNAGSDPSWRSPAGQTLAHLYAQGRDDYMVLEVLRTLHNYGVDMSAVDKDGQTILHYLVRHEGLTANIMRYLLQYTTLDTNHEDLHGRTAVQLLSPEPADTSDLSTREKEAERLREILRMPRPQSGPDPDEMILKNLRL